MNAMRSGVSLRVVATVDAADATGVESDSIAGSATAAPIPRSQARRCIELRRLEMLLEGIVETWFMPKVLRTPRRGTGTESIKECWWR